MSLAYRQYLNAKHEVEASMLEARSLRDEWIAANRDSPTNFPKKQVDHIGKTFRNRLLAVKWDCDDLEELVSSANENDAEKSLSESELAEVKRFVEGSRLEISQLMGQLEEAQVNSKLFNKHGITYLNTQTTTTPIAYMDQAPSSRHKLLSNNDPEEIQFDKNQLETGVSVFNNALYDHFEDRENNHRQKPFDSPQVFNNLSRPVTNIYTNPNDNDMILDMLETEYYNAPSGLLNGSRFNYTIRKLLETDRNKFLGTIAFLFSFPIMIILFLVI